MKQLETEEILRYGPKRRNSFTVKRAYIEWRNQQNPPIPIRCDIPDCLYFTEPLEWNGQKLKLILDHENGVHGDNRPKNLRFLCPNCNSQQSTNGGANKGKVKISSGGFGIKRKDGKFNYTLPAESASYKVTGGDVNLTKIKKNA